MSVLESAKTEVVNSDVLVIGGGIAGCMAAIMAREKGLNTILVDKGNVGRSGISFQMSGSLTYFDPSRDNHDVWYRECVEASQWLSDQSRLSGMIPETTNLIKRLRGWGVQFQTERGDLIRKPGVGHQHTRNVFLSQGGFQLMSVLRGEVLRSGVPLVERVMVTDFLTSDGYHPTNGRIVGAVGFHTRTGTFYVFKAKAVVLATGGTNWLWWKSAIMPSLSGDGQAMAFRVGCEMRNYDIAFIRFFPKGFNCAPGANILFGEGATIVNAHGDRFLDKWDTVRMERAPATVVCRAMASEELAGRGPIYWDATNLDEAAHSRIRKAIPIVVRNFEMAGLDLRKDRIIYSCGLRDLGPGGVRVDKNGSTTVSGLYCAGASSDHAEDGVTNVIEHGVESAIGGLRAGQTASEYAQMVEAPAVNDIQVGTLKGKMLAPMTRVSGLQYREVWKRCMTLHERGLLGSVRNEHGLLEALATIEEIRQDELPELVARDYHEVSRCLGIGNALLFLELVARSALLRTESRGSHYREDYPKRDDVNWLKWIIAKKDDDSTKVWAEPIPFDEYPLKP